MSDAKIHKSRIETEKCLFQKNILDEQKNNNRSSLLSMADDINSKGFVMSNN